MKTKEVWGCSSVIECMDKAFGSIPSTEKRKETIIRKKGR
jgi:hypothetical protein